MKSGTKSGFGAGHSLTLCKAAANARIHKVHHRRISEVRPSIDTSEPHTFSDAFNFDDSKGKLQKKIDLKYRNKEDDVTKARIKKLQNRCPIAGETLHDKLVGGSFHSPPRRATDALDRANKLKKANRKKSITMLEKRNLIIAARLKKVTPSEVSRRHGNDGWENHWNKHAHWQHTNEKRRTLMQKMVNAKLGGASATGHGSNNGTNTVSKPPPPSQNTSLQPYPPFSHKMTSMKHERDLFDEKMYRTKNMIPILKKEGRIINPTEMTNAPVMQQYINRLSVAESTVFSPHAPPRKNLPPVDDLISLVLNVENENENPATERIPHRPAKQHNRKQQQRQQRPHGQRKQRQQRKQGQRKQHGGKKKKKRNMPARSLTLSQEKLVKLDEEWANLTKVQQNSNPSWEDVMSVQSGMDRVTVSRWHDGVLEAIFDPYASTDGPGWRCDVCSNSGTGLVYHDQVLDVDICLKCMNMARRLDWVEVAQTTNHISKSTTHKMNHNATTNQNNTTTNNNKKQKTTRPSHLDMSTITTNDEEIEDDDDDDDDTTWATYKPNQPNSPINIVSPFATVEDMEQRDQLVYRCGTREHSIHGTSTLLLITIFRSPDGLLLSDDPNNSLLIDVFDMNTNVSQRSILTGTDMMYHPEIGSNGVRLLIGTTIPPGNQRSKKISKKLTRTAENLIHLLVIDPLTRSVTIKEPIVYTEQQKQEIIQNKERIEKEQAAVVMQNSYRSAKARTTTQKKRAQLRTEKANIHEKNNAASLVQARIRGGNDRQKVQQIQMQRQKSNMKKRKKKMIFPGVLGQAFCTKGTFFDNARIFGLISVQIYDGATKADIKRNELAAAACSKTKSKRSKRTKRTASISRKKKSKNNAMNGTGTNNQNGKHGKHGKNSNAINAVERTREIRQLLFTVYFPTNSQFYRIKVSAKDVTTLFEHDIELAKVIIQDPTAPSNKNYILEMIGMIHVEYTQLGFGGSQTLKAYMSREVTTSPMEEEQAALSLQTRWRVGIARRKVHSRKMIVCEIHDLLNTIHERGGTYSIIDLKHTRVELLSHIAFEQEWRDAYIIAARFNKHVAAHPEFVKGLQRNKLLVPKITASLLVAIQDEEEEAEETETSVLPVEVDSDPEVVKTASEAEKRAACRAIFHQVDTDMSGYIDSEELVLLLTNLTDELKLTSNKHEITLQEAEYFISSMDKDGNLLIDCDEFVDFMVAGMSVGDDAKVAFRERSSLHEKLSVLISGLSEMTERRSRALQKMYEKYEDKDAGGLTTDTLFQLFSEAETDVIHRYDDVQRFFQVMDEDRNGAISRDEWCSYLLYGMNMPDEWRTEFGRRSPMHAKIASVVQLCLDHTTESTEGPVKRNSSMVLYGKIL